MSKAEISAGLAQPGLENLAEGKAGLDGSPRRAWQDRDGPSDARGTHHHLTAHVRAKPWA